MAAFEFSESANAQNCCAPVNNNTGTSRGGGNNTKIEDIIAFKIYDSCRSQDCLDYGVLGPARAAEDVTIDGRVFCAGDVIVPPCNAASVTLQNPEICKIVIVDKSENCFRKGYWDIDLRYIIKYQLVFRNSCGEIISIISATNIFNSKVSLFGSESCDLFVATDLINTTGSFEGEPFVLAEGKVVGLTTSLLYECVPGCHSEYNNPSSPMAVEVTLGLFSIVKLFRIVDLAVQSTGFTIPDECEETTPLCPCTYFDGLDFPMDIFAPPQKPEFLAGISSNIPSNNNNSGGCNNDCGCGKNNNDCGCSR